MTPEERIEDLERRLEEYHLALGEAIKSRDKLAHDAAWGTVGSMLELSVYFMACLIVLLAVAKSWWWLLAVSALLVLFGPTRAKMNANKDRMEEQAGMAELPDWESRSTY